MAGTAGGVDRWIGRVFGFGDSVYFKRYCSGGYTPHVCDNPQSGEAQKCTPIMPELRNLSWIDPTSTFTMETTSPRLTKSTEQGTE